MDTLPLLCRIPLLPGESLRSYLVRLAAANCYAPATLTWLCNKHLAEMGLHGDLTYLQHPETFVVLVSLSRLTPRELADASVHYFARAPVLAKMESPSIYLSDGAPFQLLDQRMRSRYLLRDHDAQFCPDCLREAAYHRLDWIPADVLACLKHQRLLLNRCPGCHARVSVQDVVRCQCSACGANLTNATTDHTLEPFGLFAQRTIRVWWGLDVPAAASTAWTLPDQPVHILHQLFEMLQDSIKAETSVAPTQTDQYNVQLRAFKALADWPTGFRDFLRKRLEREVRLHSYCHWCDFSEPVYLRGGSSFAFWVRRFEDWPMFDFAQEAVDRFAAENNIQVEPTGWWNPRILIEADEELQRIARPLAEKGLKRITRMMESL